MVPIDRNKELSEPLIDKITEQLYPGSNEFSMKMFLAFRD